MIAQKTAAPGALPPPRPTRMPMISGHDDMTISTKSDDEEIPMGSDDDDDDTAIGALMVATKPLVCMAPSSRGGVARRERLFDPSFSLKDYITIRSLGKGTSGIVTLRRHRESGKMYAIKKTDYTDFGDISPEVFGELLLRELDHPNVMGICKAGFHIGTMSLAKCFVTVMDVAGCDMYTMVKQGTPIHPFEFNDIGYQFLRGIAYCQSRMINNYDVKPKNVLLFGTDKLAVPGEPAEHNLKRVVIADMGLGAAFAIAPISNTCQYTLWYRPPELLMGRDTATPKGDVWAAGCTLFELATGNYLFPTGSDVAFDQMMTIANILGAPPKHLHRWYPSWDWDKYPTFPDAFDKSIRSRVTAYPGLADLLRKMLCYDPAERCSIFDALADQMFKGVATRIEELIDVQTVKLDPSRIRHPLMKYRSPDKLDIHPEYAVQLMTERLDAGNQKWYDDQPVIATNDRAHLLATILKLITDEDRDDLLYECGCLALDLCRVAYSFDSRSVSDQMTNKSSLSTLAIASYLLARKARAASVCDIPEYLFILNDPASVTRAAITARECELIKNLDGDLFFPTAYDIFQQLAISRRFDQKQRTEAGIVLFLAKMSENGRASVRHGIELAKWTADIVARHCVGLIDIEAEDVQGDLAEIRMRTNAMVPLVYSECSALVEKLSRTWYARFGLLDALLDSSYGHRM
jgi:serine/threonine protein kinase